MPPFPQMFPPLSDPAIASYNWQDIATQRGYIQFDAGKVTDANVLTTTPFFSTKGGVFTSASTGSAVDVDFDIIIGKPLDILGNAIVTLPVYFKNNTAGTQNLSSNVVIYLRKYDGTSETQLATKSVTVTDELLTGQTRGWIYSFKLPITTLAHFKDGDILRLTLTATYVGATDQIIWFYHDPKDRAVTTDTGYPLSTSRFIAEIPMRIDI